jgi:hypothetical protein
MNDAKRNTVTAAMVVVAAVNFLGMKNYEN